VLEKKGVVVKLKVAGSIIKDNDLSQYFNELKQVEYVGVVHGKEKQDLLVWSNVFCLPTFYKMEGQPISILEAMALGNLILTTKHPGITDVCKDENAIFCDKESVKDLVQKLEFLSNNLLHVAEIGLFNIEYSNKMFSEEKFIDNANEILLKCIN
jgi:glycosyltransferase involved in cell wall biosynthesis